METRASRPWGINLVGIVNAIAAVITLAFWLLVWHRLFHTALPVTLDQAATASTLGFMIADLVWAVPLLITSVPGLWRLQA
jgi:hypothetical protein